MVDEMLVAQQQWLPQYKTVLAEAEAKLRSGKLIPTRENYRVAAYIEVKSVEQLAKDLAAATQNAQASEK